MQPQVQAPVLPEKPRESPEKAEYLLQIHSFQDSDTAEQTAKELRALNLSSFVVHHAVPGGTGWFGVYVGPFSDLETAQRVDSEIRVATGATPILRERIARANNLPPQ
jgi:cell division protein FtsN